MTAKDTLVQILDELPDDRLEQLLDYARYLGSHAERSAWRQFGSTQLEKAYGDCEPEYTENDLQTDLPK